MAAAMVGDPEPACMHIYSFIHTDAHTLQMSMDTHTQPYLHSQTGKGEKKKSSLVLELLVHKISTHSNASQANTYTQISMPP